LLVVTLSAIATDTQWLSSKAKTYENQTDNRGDCIMTNSNVRSSEYKAAGGRAWYRAKVSSGVSWQGPKTETALAEENQALVDSDQYYVDKAKVRQSLEQGYDESKVTVVPAGKSGIKKRTKNGWRKA
jgi:hypothetical protein